MRINSSYERNVPVIQNSVERLAVLAAQQASAGGPGHREQQPR